MDPEGRKSSKPGSSRCSLAVIGRNTESLETLKQGDTSGQRLVIVHVTYLKFGEINTLTEQFDADVLVRAKWREPCLDLDGNIEKEEVNLENYWNPLLFIENSYGDPKVASKMTLYYDKKGKAWLQERKRFQGTYMEQLELEDFPFDVQDLTVFVMSELPVSQVDLVEAQEFHKINRHNFFDDQEWYLYKYLESKKFVTSRDPAEPNRKVAVLRVRARAARRPSYFIFNNVLVTFLIVVLCFTTFAVRADLPQNRLQLTFTLVLTTIAFKFVVNQTVPKRSYLTHLDRYVLVCMITLVLVAIWHAVVILVDNEYLDGICMGCVIGLYLTYNIYFWFTIYRGPYEIRRTMKWKEINYVLQIKEVTARPASPPKTPRPPTPAAPVPRDL